MDCFEKVAKKYNTTPEEVKREIEKGIEAGYNSPDPNVRAVWRKYFPDGNKPDAETLVSVLVKLRHEKSK